MKKYVPLFTVILVGLAAVVFIMPKNPAANEQINGRQNEQLQNVSGEQNNVSLAPDTAVQREDAAYYGDARGYLAYPTEGGSHPGIILIHEWWGLNDDIRELADRFAGEGYVALAVDLYNGKSTTVQAEAQQLSDAVRNDTDGAFANLRAAVDYLRARPDVDDTRLASVGWCFGGAWSYNMAKNDLGTRASIMYYGQFDPKDDLSHMRALILGHFGEDDASIKVDNVREFQAKLETLNGEHEIYIYPNAGHGFANFRGGANQAYNEDAAELAWERTLSFLGTALR